MTRQMERMRRAHGEEGMALMLALVFLALFGLIVAALLNWGFTAERSDSVVKSKRDSRYANDGAIEGAIKRFQAIASSGSPNPCPNANFFKYTVNGKAATVACNAVNTGGTPNPPQSLLPTSIGTDGVTDFVPYNTTTSKTLVQTLQYFEENGASGTVATTAYPKLNSNTVSFGYGGVSPPVGALYTQVLALISHKEGDGPGDAPAQDQFIIVTTSDGVGTINCGTYPVPDAKASGGPNWPVPPYSSVDVTYFQDNSAACLNTPTRIQNATIKYSAHETACGGRALTDVTMTSGSATITSATGNFTTIGDVSPTKSPITGTGIPANTVINTVTNPTTAVLNRNATSSGTNRTVSIGTACGAIGDTLDGITVCVCLWAKPSVVASTTPTCGYGPAANERQWSTNFGSGAVKDCNLGRNLNSELGPSFPKRIVTDGVVSAGSSVVTSAAALFTKNDEGRLISGTGIPAGAKIVTVTSTSVAVLSANATASGSGVTLTMPLSAGLFERGDPVNIGSATCANPNCSGNAHSRWQPADVNVSQGFALSGFNWPAIGPVIYVSLRVVHRENVAWMTPVVTINFPGSSCPPITLPSQTGNFTENSLILDPGCAPDTQAEMSGLTLTYTVTCGNYPGGSQCAPGAQLLYAYVDSITLDLDYQLGGSGGPAGATFTSTVAGSGASASANAIVNPDNTVSVSGWQSSH